MSDFSVRDAIASNIERITGWRPAGWTKTALEWIGACTGAVLGVWGLIALIGGGGQATKEDIETLRIEFRTALAKRVAPGIKEGFANQSFGFGVLSVVGEDEEPNQDEGLSDFERVKAVDGDVAVYYTELSDLYRRRGDLDKAEEMHRKSLEEGMAN